MYLNIMFLFTFESVLRLFFLLFQAEDDLQQPAEAHGPGPGEGCIRSDEIRLEKILFVGCV